MKTHHLYQFKAVLPVLFILLFGLSGCISAPGPIKAFAPGDEGEVEISRLLVPRVLDVVSIDYKKIDLPFGLSDPYEIELLPGRHIVKFVYLEDWGSSDVDYIINSDVYEIEFESRPGQDYKLTLEIPRTPAQAEKLVENFQVWIDDPTSGQRYSSRYSGKYYNPLTRLFKEDAVDENQRLQLDTARDAVKPQAENVSSAELKVTPATSETLPNVSLIPIDASARPGTDLDQQNALEQLKLWWKQADESDRSAFLNWIVKQQPQ